MKQSVGIFTSQWNKNTMKLKYSMYYEIEKKKNVE